MKRIKLPSYERWGQWLFLLTIFKIFFLCLFYSFFLGSIKPEDMEGYVFINKDFDDYYKPLINLINNGIYEYETGSNLPYAGRLPGYLLPCYFIFILFNKVAALHVIVILQLFFSIAASYLLAVLVHNISRSYKLFLIVLLSFNLFSIYTHYDITFHPTSFGNSVFIIALYFIYLFYEKRSSNYLLLTGIFLTWLVLLRPILLPSFVLFLFLSTLIFIKDRYPVKAIVRNLLLLVFPLLVFETFWIIRNYRGLNKFVPLIVAYESEEGKTMSAMYPNTISYPILKLRDLISSWGGDNLWYLPGSEMNWFLQMPDEDARNYRFKDHQLCSAYNQDSLGILRNNLRKMSSSEPMSVERIATENEIIEVCERYTQAYRSERWGWYYFVSPALRIKDLIFRNAVQDWPGPSFKDSGWGYKIYKLCCLGLYLVVSTLALIAIPFLFYNYKKLSWFEIFALGFYLALIFTFAFLINFVHWVYFYTGIASSFLILSIFYHKIVESRQAKKQTGFPLNHYPAKPM